MFPLLLQEHSSFFQEIQNIKQQTTEGWTEPLVHGIEFTLLSFPRRPHIHLSSNRKVYDFSF